MGGKYSAAQWPRTGGKKPLIAGSFRGGNEDSVYIWSRRFESERLYAAVYESDHWKNSIAPGVAELINREIVDVKRIVPTGLSILQ